MRSLLFTLILAFGSVYSNALNNSPTIDQVSDQTVDEDVTEQSLPLTGITDGDEGSQTLTLSVTSDNPDLFSILSIDTGTNDTTLVYQPAPDANGEANVTVTVDDGISTTDMTFKITVNPVNDPPTIDPHADVTVDEDAGTVHVTLTGLSGGPADEGQGLLFTLYSSNPVIVNNMDMTYTTGEPEGVLNIVTYSDSVGITNIEITVTDDSYTNSKISFDLTVLPVNDAPVFDAIDNISLENDGIEHAIDITGIAAGPPNEVSQTLTFSVSNDNNSLFTAQPVIDFNAGDNTAVLRYTPDIKESGDANVTITLTDDGGTANGGVNISEQTFKITISPSTPAAIKPLHQDVISLYPNPVRNLLNISLPEKIIGKTLVEIYSLKGELIQSGSYSGNNIRIPVNKLNSGLYQIKINSNNNIYTDKFIVR